MTLVKLIKPENTNDTVVKEIFDWVIESDFASYYHLKLSLNTQFYYGDLWRKIPFKWQYKEGALEGDNSRGIR